MRTIDLIRMGLSNLSRRKARTALTVVGVVIGTISIVVMISIGVGMNTTFKEQVMQLGSLTTLTIDKQSYQEGGDGNYMELTQVMDAKFLESVKNIEHVKLVIPMKSANLMVYCGKYEGQTSQFLGIDYSYLKELGLPNVTYGEFPTEEDKDTFLLGSNAFWLSDPKSRNRNTITFEPGKYRIQYTIMNYMYNNGGEGAEKKPKKTLMNKYAVLESKQDMDMTDYSVYMNMDNFEKEYLTYIKTLDKTQQKKALKAFRNYDKVKVKVDNVKYVKEVQQKLKDMGYNANSLGEMLESSQKTSDMLQMVLGGVGAVAMLVSAISIANTMIMSIYERTKEIGVMKVLGCVITDIKKLFLFEAGMIGLIGGIVGIVVSYIISFCINKFGGSLFQALMSAGSFYGQEGASKFSIIPFWLPLLAAGFAVLIGLISGYYPANRATKISAIEAMKSD